MGLLGGLFSSSSKSSTQNVDKSITTGDYSTAQADTLYEGSKDVTTIEGLSQNASVNITKTDYGAIGGAFDTVKGVISEQQDFNAGALDYAGQVLSKTSDISREILQSAESLATNDTTDTVAQLGKYALIGLLALGALVVFTNRKGR